MIRLELANRELKMDNENLRAVVKKLERDIVTQEFSNAVSSGFDQPRSNSVPIRSRMLINNHGLSKKHILNPFLRVQMKLEVIYLE